MAGITPPFLEFHFYFATLAQTDALWRVIESAVSLGATTHLSHAELLDYVINADADALRVEMNGVSGTQYRSAGIVRYGSISERAAHSGYPRPISIG
jgi:hypothetical protein